MGEDWEYGYDTDASHPDHLLATITDPSSTTILTTTYDTEGLAVFQEDALNTLADIGYNTDDTTDIENGRGYTSTHTYDIRETLTGESNPAGLDVDKTYDLNFRPEQITVVSDTHQTTLDWSVDGANLEEITNAMGGTTDLDYDSLNNLTAFMDPRGNSTNYEYDETLLISNTNSLLQTTQYTYTTSADAPQPEDLLKSITTPLGTTVYTYTATGQLYQMKDAEDRVATYTYNDWGLLETVTDPAGHTDWTCYDDAGRVVRTVVNANGTGDPCNAGSYVPSTATDEDRITTYQYDVKGNLIAVTDPGGRVTRTYYDNANRLVSVVQSLVGQSIAVGTPPARDAVADQNIRTDTTYDANGNVISIEDNAEIETYYCYDELDRLVRSVQNPAGTYAAACDPDTYTPSSSADIDIITQMGYDDFGNVITATNPAGTVTYTCYDDLNRPIRTVFNPSVGDPCSSYTPDADGDEDVIVDTQYDANGNVIANIEWLVEDSQVISRTSRTYYNALNQPSLVIRNLDTSTYQILDEDPPPMTDYGNDENVAIETIYHPDNGLAIATVEYLIEDTQLISHTTRTYYDDLGRISEVVRNITEDVPDLYDDDWPAYNPLYPDQNVRTEYQYDDAGNQIASIEVLTESDTVITRSYYDGLGRPVTVVRNLTGQSIGTSTPPARNLNGPADENVRTDMQYDAYGNIEVQTDPLGSETEFEYDDLNRQVSITDPLTQTTTYAYDNAGQLSTLTDAEEVVTQQFPELG